jgi:uncharacterized membrane protein
MYCPYQEFHMDQQEQNIHNPSPQENTLLASVAYIAFFVPLLTPAKADSFVLYHVKQGMVLFIIWFAVMLIGWMSFFGLISFITHALLLVLTAIGMWNALSGKQKALPIIGSYAENLRI